jgi:hypothetical protein
LPEHSALIPNPVGPHLVLYNREYLEYWRLSPDGPRRERVEEVPSSYKGLPVLSESQRIVGSGRKIVLLTNPAQVVEIDELMLDSLIPSPSGKVLAGRGSMWSCFAGMPALASDLYLFSPEGEKLFHEDLEFGIYDLAFRLDEEAIAVATERELIVFDLALRRLWSRPEAWSHIGWVDNQTMLGTTSRSWTQFIGGTHSSVPTLQLIREGQEEPIASFELDDYPGALALDRERGRIVLALGDRIVVLRLDS